MKYYLVANNYISEELCDIFNKNLLNSSNALQYIDGNISEIYDLEEDSTIFIPIFYEKQLNDNYFIDHKIINKDFIKQISVSKCEVIYKIFYNQERISFKDLEDIFTYEFLNDEVFEEKFISSELTQKSFLDSFSGKFLSKDQMNKFIEVFSSLSSNGHERPNQFFSINEKLDQIRQEVLTIRSLPLYLRTHSLTYRLLYPLISSAKKIKQVIPKVRSLIIQNSKDSLNTIHIKQFSKFLKIANSKIASNKIRLNQDSDDVELSIIIPVFGKLDFLARALYSIQEAQIELRYEVIVVDDAGPEKVRDVFNVDNAGFKLFENKHNLGFTGTCNRGAEQANGKFLCFLNSDAVVTDYWADRCVSVMEENNDIGIVGSRLIYEDGILQESGGGIFQGGHAENIGKSAFASESIFRYLREVDYVSGAALFISNKDFQILDGFDSRFSPAYYEDTSLCMDIRKNLGKRVFVNPTSTVIHAEGATNGTDVSSGIKKYQKVNRSKFIKKHVDELSNFPSRDSSKAQKKDRYVSGNILIIDQCIPTPNEDSGSKDMDCIIKSILDINYRPHLFALSNRGELDDKGSIIKDIDKYFGMGAHCVYRNTNNSFNEFFQENAYLFDLIIISRVTSSVEVLDFIKEKRPDVPILFYTVDLHHLRLESEYISTRNEDKLFEVQKTKSQELEAINETSETVVLSHAEKKYLHEEHNIANEKIMVWPLIRSEFEKLESFEKDEVCEDIIFFGGFKHSPNIEAIKILENKLLPVAKKYFSSKGYSLPKIKIYGSNPTSYIKNINSNLMTYKGFIEDEADAFKTARISLAPLPFGAGLKGKVLSSFTHSTPVLGTNFAFEGFENLDKKFFTESSLNADEFSEKLFDIYFKKSLNTSSSDWNDFHKELEKIFSINSFKKIFKEYLLSKDLKV